MMLRRTIWLKCGAVPALLAICAMGALCRTTQVGSGNKAEDPVGAWIFRSVSPDGKHRECVVTVYREGTALKGDYTTDGMTRPAKNVAFDDGVLSVDVDGKFAGQAYGLTYRGVPAGRRPSGLVRFSFGWASGSFAFEGERIQQESPQTADDPRFGEFASAFRSMHRLSLAYNCRCW